MPQIENFFQTTTKQLFLENEYKANTLIAKCLLVLGIVYAACLGGTLGGIFEIEHFTFTLFFSIQVVFCVSSFFIIRANQKKKATKYYALISIFLSINSFIVFIFDTELLIAIPIILSCRYYSKKLTLSVSLITFFGFIFAKILSTYYGMVDLNMVELPDKTVIVVDEMFDKTVAGMRNNFVDYFYYTITASIIPNLLFLAVIAFSCYKLTRHSYKMMYSHAEISSKKAAVESELKMGTSIQVNMLPHNFPKSDSVELYATMTPAKEVGGDFYDFFFIDKNHLAIVIADVSGKGVPAALFMVIAKTLIKDHAQLGLSPVDVFNKVNKNLCESEEDNMFVTAWFGIIDLTTGQMDYVNAGHNPPIFCKSGEQFEYLRSSKKRLPLAAIDSICYTQESITFKPGDQLFLYTDGVTEATNADYNFYGEDRLLEFVNNHQNTELKEFLQLMKSDIDKFAGTSPQADDITMMLIRFKA